MWIYDVPLFIGLPVFTGLFVLASCLIVVALRRWVLRASQGSSEWDRVLGYAMGAYGVFYGVTLALIAAGAYGNFTQVQQIVLRESSSVAVLYRDASGFPEPTAGDLQTLLVDYTEKVIEVDWPLQARGILPTETVDEVTAIQEVLFAFEARTRAHITLHEQTVSAFNAFVHDRRARIALTDLALPGVLWIVLATGAVLNAVLIGLIEVKNVRIHLIMAGLIAVFVSLLLYAIAGFDHAYAGPIAVSPEYFQDLLEGLFTAPGG